MSVTKRAFEEYGRRSDWLDADADAKLRWFEALVESIYLPRLPESRDARILEIGCNRGYLLHALKKKGYRSLEGVDLSPREIEMARELTGIDSLRAGDAVDVLRQSPATYDAIIFKAVFEHVPREGIEPLLGGVVRAVAPGGIVLCEVPNMDWYAAAHERFMDVTHEAGYTRESLKQVFELYFGNVEVVPVVDPAHGVLATGSRRLARKAVFGMIRRALRMLGEDTADYWFDIRSILAVARDPRG